MKVLIIGAAGVIGSALTERFLKMGMDMSCLDICRIDEAWRLNNVRDQIKYIWKASNDLLLDDIRGIDVIVDSGIGVARSATRNLELNEIASSTPSIFYTQYE